MMNSADDDISLKTPPITTSTSTSLFDQKTSNNDLINDSFNLTGKVSIAPPTANHFQPIHSRTPSLPDNNNKNIKSNSASPATPMTNSIIPGAQGSLSTVPPPMSMPPKTINASSSNPYAAKGALNKKVYDNYVPVIQAAPIGTTTQFNNPQFSQSQVFVPPSSSSTSLSTPQADIPSQMNLLSE
jgi:hypothetical protein